ncbi:GDP-mannose 4,6-dehydratase [candidate division WOR-3 bacterium]|nr:GDP-mannose 4,6-dehydratase [candidate division WOR-3 bacterium]
MKKILITGAEGFIGSHLTDLLLKKYKVDALVKYNFTSNSFNLKYIKNRNNLNIIQGDITDYQFLQRISKKTDIIIHLAALIGIPYSYNAVSSYVSSNVAGTMNILECIRHNKNSHLILLSSSEIYGSAIYTPMDENHPKEPSSPYAATKLSADVLASSYIKSFKLPITIIRPFNTYGPRQSLRAVIPTIITQVIGGNKIEIGNTDTIRDFNYIDDIVKGIEKTILNSNCIGETFNLCSNKAFEINEIISIVEQISGKQLKIVNSKSRIRPPNSEVDILLGDNKKARSLIDYKALTDIYKGLSKTYKWFEKHKSEFTDCDKYHI